MRPFGSALVSIILAASAGSGVAAQEGPPPPRESAQPVQIDSVLATVNDAAIMLSAVRIEVAGERRAREVTLGRRLEPAELFVIYRRQLERLIEKHALAQSAKSFGVVEPERVEQLFADEMKREEAEQVRDLGTWQKFSRELERTGRTYETYVREQRVEKMSEFAKDFAIRLRLQKQSNLFLTPHMLRETYRERRELFQHGAEAGIAVAQFRGPDAMAHATAAAEIWAREDIAPEQLIASIPGANAVAQPIGGITEESRRSLAPELVDFALAGPLMRVSPPIRIGANVNVAKIMAYSPARDGRFEDPEVQLELRQICLDGVIGEFTKQALDRAADRTQVWKSKAFR